MALRYVARRVGVPALRRASGSPVAPPPSAASGSLAASRSYYNQARYSNGDAGWKQESEDIMDRVAKFKAEAAANAVMRANRMKKIERWMYMGSAATTVFLLWYTVVAVRRELDLMVKERDLERQVMQLMEEGMLCEEDMEEGKNE